MKARIAAVLALAALALMVAGCGGNEFKPQTTGSEEHVGQLEKGKPMAAPSGVPGMPGK